MASIHLKPDLTREASLLCRLLAHTHRECATNNIVYSRMHVTGALQAGETSEELSRERGPGTGVGSMKRQVQSSEPHISM
jgi:hypothetical protein